LSLNGNLEDLPLLDILQIVSFSKKTGYLSIRTEGGEGAIVFQEGYVVAAFSADTPPFDPRYRHLPPEARTKLLRQNIEHGLEQLIRLREGQFSFSLTEGPPRKVGPRDISEETLPQGINAQELLLDLARGMDEDRRDSTAALEASFAEPPDDVTVPPELAAQAGFPSFEPDSPSAPPVAPALPPPPPAAVPASHAAPPPPVAAPATETEITTILLVDDEDEVRRILAERFTRGGYNVVEAEDPDAAVKKAGRLGKASIPFLLVSDLETAPDDVPALTRTIAGLKQADIRLRVVPLGPSSDSVALFSGLLDKDAVGAFTHGPDSEPPVTASTAAGTPVVFLVLGLLVFALLAAHERFSGRIALPRPEPTVGDVR